MKYKLVDPVRVSNFQTVEEPEVEEFSDILASYLFSLSLYYFVYIPRVFIRKMKELF